MSPPPELGGRTMNGASVLMAILNIVAALAEQEFRYPERLRVLEMISKPTFPWRCFRSQKGNSG
jgi:hypothetical protein